MPQILKSHKIGKDKILNLNSGSMLNSVTGTKYFLSIIYNDRTYYPNFSSSNDYDEILKLYNFQVQSNEWKAKSIRDNNSITNEYEEKIAGTFEGDFFDYLGCFTISEFDTENNYSLLKLNFEADTFFKEKNQFLQKYKFPIQGVYINPNCEILLDASNFIFRFKNKANNIEIFKSDGSNTQLLMLYTMLNSYHDYGVRYY